MVGGLKAILAGQKAAGKVKVGSSRVNSSRPQVEVDDASIENVELENSCQRTSPYLPPTAKLRGSISRSKSVVGSESAQLVDLEDPLPKKSKSESRGHKRGHSHDKKTESSKKHKWFDPRSSGKTNKREIEVGEEESWFHGSKPMQVFSGFHLLNDADQYVSRSRDDVVDRAYKHLGQFTSDFVHLISGFGMEDRKRAAGAEDKLASLAVVLESKDAELERMKVAMAKKDEELQGVLATKGSAEKSLAILQKEMELVHQNREEIIKVQNEMKIELAQTSSDLGRAKADLVATQRTLEVERAEKDKLFQKISELEKTSVAAGEEGYKECWDRFVKAGADGSAFTWEKYLEEVVGDDEEADILEGKDENVGDNI